MTLIAEIIGEILGVLLVAAATSAIAVLTPKVRAWVEAKIGTENMGYLDTLIGSLTKSAEQQFKIEDPTGEIRNNYVKTELEKLGYVITNEITAMIEAHVFELPHGKK